MANAGAKVPLASESAGAGGGGAGSRGPDLTGAPPPEHKRSIRNYLLDKRLQLRYIGIVSLLSAAISGGLGYLIWYQRSYASKIIIQTLAGIDWLDAGFKGEIIRTLQGSDLYMILRMAGVCLGLIVVLSMFLIVMTHKVAGPLYKVGIYFDQLAAGRLPVVHDLRKGDEFQGFFRKFKRMSEELRTRARADLEAYDRFLAACEAAGVSGDGELGHSLEELRRRRRETEAALEG